jgi:xanthosine utilization system XapX-like protein
MLTIEINEVSIIGAIVVVKPAPALLVVGVLGMLVRNTVVHADPLVAMKVSSHAVVEHRPSLLDQVGQTAASSGIFRVGLDVTHQQDYLFAHHRALDSRTAHVQHVLLVLLHRLIDTVLQNLLGRRVLKAESPLDHLIRVDHFTRNEAVSIAA